VHTLSGSVVRRQHDVRAPPKQGEARNGGCKECSSFADR
jgi:hypothetical protein